MTGRQRKSAARPLLIKAASVYDFHSFDEQDKVDSSFATEPDSSIC